MRLNLFLKQIEIFEVLQISVLGYIDRVHRFELDLIHIRKNEKSGSQILISVFSK